MSPVPGPVAQRNAGRDANQALHRTGAAFLVSRGIASLQRPRRRVFRPSHGRLGLPLVFSTHPEPSWAIPGRNGRSVFASPTAPTTEDYGDFLRSTEIIRNFSQACNCACK